MGTGGDVGDTCAASDGGDWVTFANVGDVSESGWAWHDDTEHCRGVADDPPRPAPPDRVAAMT